MKDVYFHNRFLILEDELSAVNFPVLWVRDIFWDRVLFFDSVPVVMSIPIHNFKDF